MLTLDVQITYARRINTEGDTRMNNVLRPMWGVYRVRADGSHVYMSRSATHSEKLAREIADGLSHGEVVMPDGSVKYVKPRKHVALRIDV